MKLTCSNQVNKQKEYERLTQQSLAITKKIKEQEALVESLSRALKVSYSIETFPLRF